MMGLGEVNRLAKYNSEVTRGVVHAAETDAEMRELQRRFNAGEFKQRRQRSFLAWLFCLT